MSLPRPVPGLVIRYAFLWSHERAAGAHEAAKDRPCAVVVATRLEASGELRTIVAPITHEPPDDPAASIEIPATTRSALGLDNRRQWLRLDELNRFAWPGFDLRPLPGRAEEFAYGMLPKALFERARDRIVALQAARRLKMQGRDD